MAKAIPVGIHFGKAPLTCPVRSLKSWIKASGITTGPLFRKIDRWGNIAEKAITGQSIALIIKKLCLAAGLDPALYSGHSMRSGFCTQTAKNGKTERAIIRHSRMTSAQTVRIYIHEGKLFDDNPTEDLGL